MTIELGATTKQAREISNKSREIVRKIVNDDSLEGRIKERCVIATGDPEFANLMVFKNKPIISGIKAIKRKSNIYTDIRMVKTGIIKQKHECAIMCVLDYENKTTEFTRTSAGFMSLGNNLNDSIIVIGNAPSAALMVYKMVKNGIKPALIIATPVGFVNAAESKQAIRSLEIPSITSIGRRGGTPIAVAVMNELIHISLDYHE